MLQARMGKFVAGSRLPAVLLQQSCSFATGATDTYNVPVGHKESDLSQLACNIGLMIRRDLTLREDIKLSQGTTEAPLKDILKGQKALVVGLPGAGKFCRETHVESYLKKFDDLKSKGVTKIVAVSVASAEKLQKWAQEGAVDSKKIEVWADTNGAFTRMLGLDINTPDIPQGPWSHRYVALVNNGILVKINVDKAPSECVLAHADAAYELVSKY
eukprot:TRINITY_DN949_c0_g1_i1.p1 TRINITY_DN949_c0_g1~~TRINITY_DN949_c0_g1_i1.p1  ORF type:complete len:215 (+),score=41.70 TRINITY_DN949_c0_g1_i1:179-823(+)